MSRTSKKGFYALLLVVVVLSLASMACTGTDDSAGWVEEFKKDTPRVGDAMKIGERLEEVTCEAQGHRWDDSTNTCK